MTILPYMADKTQEEFKIISYVKMNEIRFLHVMIKNLQNGGDCRKAIKEVEDFENKFPKS